MARPVFRSRAGLGLCVAASFFLLTFAPRAGQAQPYGESFQRGDLSWLVGVGYTREMHSESPAGWVAGQIEVRYSLFPRWSAGFATGYYDLGTDKHVLVGDVEGERSLSVWPFFAHAVYEFPASENLNAYATLGGGIYWRKIGGDFDTPSYTEVGLNAGFGLSPLNRGIGGEVRLHYIPSDDGDGFEMMALMATLSF